MGTRGTTPSQPLLTDLYQLTMAYGYWKSGRADDEAVFNLFFRKAPFGGGYTVACGLIPALDYLEISKKKENLSPELLFGDALYNYFSVWVPENYPALKPILWFFPKGDKALGLKQLKEVSYNAFYTRTEAMVWLMRILNSYENDQAQAFTISEYLYQSYPDNPYFHRYYARMLYSRGRFSEAEPACKLFISFLDSRT
jgi:hypothetical protein